MKLKNLICILLLIGLTCTPFTVYGDEDIKVILNGENVMMAQKPVVVEDTTLVPVRAISEALGAAVAFDKNTVKINRLGTYILFEINSNTAVVNGFYHEIEVPATIINGSTMVPLRFIAECFNLDIIWNGETKTIYLNKEGTIKMQELTKNDTILYYPHFKYVPDYGKMFDAKLLNTKNNTKSVTYEYTYTDTKTIEEYEAYLKQGGFLPTEGTVKNDGDSNYETRSIYANPLASVVIQTSSTEKKVLVGITTNVKDEPLNYIFKANESFYFKNLEIIIGDKMSIVTAEGLNYHDGSGVKALKLPITIKNISDKTILINPSNVKEYRYYIDSDDVRLKDVYRGFDDDFRNASIGEGKVFNGYIYIEYVGEAVYSVYFQTDTEFNIFILN